MKHRSHHVVKRDESCPVLSVPKRESVMVTLPAWMHFCAGGGNEKSGW